MTGCFAPEPLEQGMQSTRMLIVGGFLGAGKTTLLAEAAGRLVRQGRRVGFITNDQAPNLVDTRLLATQGYPVEEVAGSCFCCNFDGFTQSAAALIDHAQPDVIIAEPVGSCTDLSATILQPLKKQYAERFEVSPLSVLVDPARLRQILGKAEGTLHPDAAYICYQQLEEADVVVVNKADLLTEQEVAELKSLLLVHFPGREVWFISAKTGDGVDEWLEAMLTGKRGGSHIADVDYDRYANGEAVLGWLNGSFRLTAVAKPVLWAEFGRDFLQLCRQECIRRSAEIGHVKLMIEADTGVCLGNLTSTGTEPVLRNRMSGRSTQARLVINARVETTPDTLENLVREALEQVAGPDIDVTTEDLRVLSPGRPTPTHRILTVVE